MEMRWCLSTSAKCKLVWKPHANLPDSPVALTRASKYFQMLSGPPGASHSALRLCKSILHQENVKWFGSHNRTTQQLWTATLILPDAPRCSKIGWMQSDLLTGAPRLLHRCSWIVQKLWNRIQEYPEEFTVVFKMLPNQTIKMCKFRSYWEY